MKIFDVYNNKIEKDIRVPEYICKEAKNGTPCFWFCREGDEMTAYLCFKSVSVAAVIRKGEVIFNPGLRKFFISYNPISCFYYDNGDINEVYGDLICLGFNNVVKTNAVSLMMLATKFPREKDLCKMDFIKDVEIPEYVAENTKHVNWVAGYSYIQPCGNDEFMIRLYSSYHGQVMEHSRIWAKKGHSTFFRSYKGEFYVDRWPSINHMDFTIARTEPEVEGSWLDKIGRDSLSICVGLYNKKFEAMSKAGIENVYQRLIEYIQEKDSFYDGICSLFGTCKKNAATFEDMVDFPLKAMRVFNVNTDVIVSMKWYRKIFGRKLLSSIGSDRLQEIINWMSSCTNAYGPDVYELLFKMSHAYGVKNIINYMDYLIKDHMPYTIFRLYSDYISLVDDCNLDRTAFRWKIKKDRIKRMHDSAVETANEEENGELEARYGEKIKKRTEELKEYEYSYKDLFIRIPECAMDFIREADELNNCLKGYIQKAAEGETDILFIRKNKKPDEPYFALEIRDGIVRQCHGHDNCSITEDIAKFLWHFCREKGIEYSNVLPVLDV